VSCFSSELNDFGVNIFEKYIYFKFKSVYELPCVT